MPILKTQTLDKFLVALAFQSLKLRDNSQIFTKKKKIKQTANLLGQLDRILSSLSAAIMTPALRFLHSFTQVFEQETGKK